MPPNSYNKRSLQCKSVQKQIQPIFKCGLSREDYCYLKSKFNKMIMKYKENKKSLPWATLCFLDRPVQWVDHDSHFSGSQQKVEILSLTDPNGKRKCKNLRYGTSEEFFRRRVLLNYGNKLYKYNDPQLENVLPHKAGCARALDYCNLRFLYKKLKQGQKFSNQDNGLEFQEFPPISIRSLIFNSKVSHQPLDDQTNLGVCTKKQVPLLLPKAANNHNSKEIVFHTESSEGSIDLQKKLHAQSVSYAKSSIHGWGLFATETIEQDELIIEYHGELIRTEVANVRERIYQQKPSQDGSLYMFRLNDHIVIDATEKGNSARFINHSCNSNCIARKRKFDGKDERVFIYSRKRILPGEELTIDYKFEREQPDQKLECFCGSENCKLWMN